MLSINLGLGRLSTKRLSRRSRHSRGRRLKREHDATAGTDLAKAQRDLQRAQRERAEVLGMRPKTEENARRARRLLVENNFAERIRGSFSS